MGLWFVGGLQCVHRSVPYSGTIMWSSDETHCVLRGVPDSGSILRASGLECKLDLFIRPKPAGPLQASGHSC